MKTIYGLIFFTAVINYAQIDTSVYYPLHIGDKWEYYTPGDGYSIVEILAKWIQVFHIFISKQEISKVGF